MANKYGDRALAALANPTVHEGFSNNAIPDNGTALSTKPVYQDTIK
jgi:hypothetical protein